MYCCTTIEGCNFFLNSNEFEVDPISYWDWLIMFNYRLLLKLELEECIGSWGCNFLKELEGGLNLNEFEIDRFYLIICVCYQLRFKMDCTGDRVWRKFKFKRVWNWSILLKLIMYAFSW